MSDLFRREAVSHSLRKLDGEVLLGSSLSWVLVSYGLAAVVFAALLFASLATYARTESVSGWLLPHAGIIRLAARSGGVLEGVTVREGDLVDAGRPLARIRVSMGSSNGDSGRILEESARAQLRATDLGAKAQIGKLLSDRTQLSRQRIVLKARRDEVADVVTILTSKRSLAESNLARAQTLKSNGYLSQQALDAASNALLTARHDVVAAKGDLLAVDEQLAQVASQIAAQSILIAQANSLASADQDGLGQKLEQITASNEYTLTSPIRGKVMALPVEVGQAVAAGSSILVLAPLDTVGGRTWLFLILSGLATGAYWLCYFKALKLGVATRVAPIDKLSVILVAVFGVAFLGEKLSTANWLGVAFVGAGVLLLTLCGPDLAPSEVFRG